MIFDGIDLLEGTTIANIAIPNGTAIAMHALATPSIGELFFQTDGVAGLYVYNGTAWVRVVKELDLASYVATSAKGVADGVASLDSAGKVPSAQLPSYVDDVVEYANLAAIQALGTGESGKIYIAADTSLTYRYSGSAFVAVGAAGGSNSASDLTSGTLSASRLPAFSGDISIAAGSSVTTVAKLRGITVSTTAPTTNGQVLSFNASNSQAEWVDQNLSATYQPKNANLTSVAAVSTATTGLLKIANGVVSTDTTAYLSGTVPVANGGTNATSFTAPSSNVAPLVYFDGTKLATDASVADAGYNTVTNTLTANNFSSTGTHTVVALRETPVAIAASAIDMQLGTLFTKTITAATTFTTSNVPATGLVCAFTLELTNGGSSAITWWTGIKWTGGTAPTLTSAGVDILGFYTRDGGTTWRGFVSSKDSK